jgi:hypothetical protein
VLLGLPHRQFVFTMPKVLRPFFRHDRRLFSSVSRLIFALVGEFYTEAAGRSLMIGMIVAHQTYGDMLRLARPLARARGHDCWRESTRPIRSSATNVVAK